MSSVSFVDDDGAARIAEAVADVLELFDDDAAQLASPTGENGLELGDVLAYGA